MIVAPVADLLEEPEIIIIPDPLLYRMTKSRKKQSTYQIHRGFVLSLP